MHERRTVCAILCVLLFASFSVVFTSITGTAYAQAPQTITPTITLVSSPCDLDTAPSPCLVATSTSIRFDISFDSITLNRTTFETTDVVWVDNDERGHLHDEYGTFKYLIHVYEDDIVTLRIPAGSVSDTSGNTNSAAEITIRVDRRAPAVQIPSEYEVPDGAYRQFVQINQPYVAPTVTCIDEVYDGMVLLRTDRYDVVADKVVTTDVDPDDLPRIINVRYSCQDEAQRTGIEYLKVHLVEDLAVINRSPTVTSIDRNNPSAEDTDSQELVYRVVFSKDVTGVDTRDFDLSPDSTGGRENNPDGIPDPFTETRSPLLAIPYNDTVSDAITVPDSIDATSVSVAVDISHRYVVDLKVDLVAPDGTVMTLHDRTVKHTANLVQTYNPSFADMDAAGNWILQINDNRPYETGILRSWTLTVHYGPAFTPTIAKVTGYGSEYRVTVPAITSGTYNLDLVSSGHGIIDIIGNALTNTTPTSGRDQTYNVSITDNTAPALASIQRHDPADQDTDSQTLVYQVTFSEDVTGVDLNDFVLSPDSTGNTTTTNPVTSITGSGDTYRATVTASVDGTYNLDLVSSGHGIKDAAENPLTDTAPTTGTDQTYTVDTTVADETAPALASIQRHDPADQDTDSQTLVYQVTFSEDVTGVDLNDFVLSPDSTGNTTTTNPVTSITGSGDTYRATVTASVDGTYNLDLVSSGHGIKDAAENPLTDTAPTTGTDQTYTVDTTVADETAPALASIQRHDPADQDTDSQTLVYQVTFSEDVTGVDLNDFVLSPDSTGNTTTTNPVTSITGSGDTYRATVTASVDGTYNLDLVSSGHGIKDAAENPLTDTAPTTGTDQTYTVDTTVADETAPALASIQRHDPADQDTDSQTLVYQVTFSEDVTGVDLNDFVLSPDSTGNTTTTNPVTSITGSGDTYRATVTASVDGTYNLDLVSSGHGIKDAAENPLTDTAPTTGTDQTYTVDTTVADETAPALASIQRHDPADQDTDSQTLVYQVTFSEDVTGVDLNDFVLSPGSTGNTTTTNPVTSITGSGDTYRATVTASVDGTYNLDLVSSGHGIKDAAENPLTDTAPTTGTDQTYTVDTTVADETAPALASIQRHDPADQDTDSQTLVYQVTFSEDVTGVDLNDFVLSPGSTGNTTTTNPVTSITGSGDTYRATVTASVDGTYNLDLVSSGHGIKDAAENPLTDTAPTTGTDQTYTVDTTVADETAPALASIQRHDPADQDTDSQTLVYQVTFSEDVTGVDLNDFVLSPNSTGGGNSIDTTADPERFTQTRSPSLAIPYNDTVSDAITVPDSGNATSVSVAIDISHAYIGDLKVDLVAPDGTLVTLHDREGGSDGDIVRIYAPSFDGVSIAGAWTLKINDNYEADSGTLNSWTLTIDYDPAVIAAPAVTADPVTGVSGSGNTYHVTVSASVDGTYNIDLVSSGHGIKDAAENPLNNTAPTTGTDHTYAVSIAVVDETAPALASIQQYIPENRNTDIQTLVYRAVFSEDVSGVDVDDFVLSPDSTGGGGGNSTTGSKQFTQTRSPSLAIPYNDTVSDAITVPDSGNATSVLVAIDISHAYIGDLKVDLVAPDGTLVTLHDHEGGSDGDIVRTYAPSFDGVSIAGAWTLKINDNYEADSGTLNSWKLAINHGTTTTTAGPVTGVSGSGDTYHVTVFASANGTYNLDLVSSGHGIKDAVENPLNNTAPTTGADYTYTVSIAAEDTTAPALASIQRYSPEVGNTDDRTLVYKVTFSEDMEGVGTDDFVLSPDSTGSTATANPVTVLVGFYSVYHVTVFASDDGTYNLDLVSSGHGISDTAGNPLTDTAPTTGTDQTYAVGGTAVDDTAPALASIQRHDPANQDTDSQTLVYRTVFSEDVTGVGATDFVLSPDSTGGGSNTATSSEQFTQTHLPSSPITDNSDTSDTITIPGSGTVTSVSVSVDISHTYIGDLKVDLVAPDGTVRTLHNRTGGSTDDIVKTYTPDFDDNVQIQGGWKLNIRDNADRDTGTLNSWTLEVGYDTTITTPSVSPVTGVSGSGSAYYVTVFASANGTYNLDLVSSGHGIRDAAENPLNNTVPTTGTDHTYTVRGIVADDTAPELASIQRYIPETQNTGSLTLVYKATFSEDVTGVDLNDFVLSPDSTGGGGNTTTTQEQFTQTRPPALAIPDRQTVSDAITIPGSGTVTSVSVSVDISHTYIGDLKVDLVAPDGTVRTLHNRTGGSTENIVKTYAPDFGDTGVQGIWKLKVGDYADRDTGTLNSWTLEVDYDTAAATPAVSPVTGVAGYGDVYFVVVSAPSDGTYNLDLVSSGHGIEDTAGNPLTDTAAGTDQTYTVSTDT